MVLHKAAILPDVRKQLPNTPRTLGSPSIRAFRMSNLSPHFWKGGVATCNSRALSRFVSLSRLSPTQLWHTCGKPVGAHWDNQRPQFPVHRPPFLRRAPRLFPAFHMEKSAPKFPETSAKIRMTYTNGKIFINALFYFLLTFFQSFLDSFLLNKVK